MWVCKRAGRALYVQFENSLERALPLLLVACRCCVCYLATRQHLMAQCDGCRRHYHIDCLDPPLDAVPKKMKNYAWYAECMCVELCSHCGVFTPNCMLCTVHAL